MKTKKIMTFPRYTHKLCSIKFTISNANTQPFDITSLHDLLWICCTTRLNYNKSTTNRISGVWSLRHNYTPDWKMSPLSGCSSFTEIQMLNSWNHSQRLWSVVCGKCDSVWVGHTDTMPLLRVWSALSSFLSFFAIKRSLKTLLFSSQSIFSCRQGYPSDDFR